MAGNVLVSLAMVCIVALSLRAQSADLPPADRLNATDVYNKFRLPPLKDRTSPLASAAASLHVIDRAHTLGITAQSATEAWQKAELLLAAANTPEPVASEPPIRFSGAEASALNRILAAPGPSSITVTSPAVEIDEPLLITRKGVTLDLGMAQLTTTEAPPYLIRIENTSGVSVKGGTFHSGDSAILVNGCDRVTVEGTDIRGLAGDGIVVTGSSSTVIRDNQISGLGGASIVLHGATASTVVERNDITRNRGSSNMTPAILVSDRDVDLAARAGNILSEDGYWPRPQPMAKRLKSPHDNVIALNHLAWNAASGIYIDGAMATVIALNLIEGNAKEGICLDNGATANVIAVNNILQNGNRWGESDSIMARESIAGGGRLPNGTPASKVPGISIDNAVYNIIFSNTVSHNFGGGIKIVRTGYFNAIGLNTIYSNNDGASEAFHFFGIELELRPSMCHRKNSTRLQVAATSYSQTTFEALTMPGSSSLPAPISTTPSTT